MKNQALQSGLLQVVGTPIGNLSDISERAKKALAGADLVACEDTRRCGQLYRLLGITTPKMVSFYKENEGVKAAGIVKALLDGKTVVLVSDGGMPGVSDPGAGLVLAARKALVRVEVIPGASAVVTAVAGSGFEGGFVFVGFPERKEKALKAQLDGLKNQVLTLVFYESPQRVEATVDAMLEVWGNREAWLARELTKMHEEWLGQGLAEISAELKARGGVKGECVLVVKGGDGRGEAVAIDDKTILAKLKGGMSARDVSVWVAEAEGVSKKVSYARVLGLKG
jgi:16S rRNA (cytidine1402-2'-O)-methyltransferase